MNKSVFLFFLTLLSNAVFSQCELSVSDTTHVKCFGQSTGSFTLQTSAVQPFEIYLSNGIVQNNDLVFTDLFAEDYTVVVLDDMNCTDTIQIKIKEPSRLNVDLSCQNGLVVATPSGGVQDYTYSWKSDVGDEISQSNSVPFESNFLFDFSLTDQNECVFADTVFVSANFTLDSVLGQLPFEVIPSNLSSEGQYSWDFGGLFNSTSKNPTYLFESVGQYQIDLVVLDDFGCEDSKQITVDVQGFDYELNDWEEFPNAFSPNDDGINDFFSFENSHALEEFDVTIFNRWGKPLISWDSPSFKWFGKSKNGVKVTEGVYFYYLKAIGRNGKLYEKKGVLTMFE